MSELTDDQWKAAHAIAERIVQDGANAGELKKAMAYLRTCADEPDGGSRFFKYLGNLVRGGNRIGHSKRTVDYYRGLNDACTQHLTLLQDQPQVMLEVLGWAGRLIAYYKDTPIAEVPIDLAAEKRSVILKAAVAAGYEVGQRVTATIAAIKGKEVTYAVSEQIKLTQKIKNLEHLAVGQSVQIEITEMRDTGIPKKIRLIN